MTLKLFSFLELGNSAILLCTAFALYLTYFVTVACKRPKLPPGPMGLPLLGNLLQILKDPHLKLSRWARQYGHMYTIYLANRAALVVNDAKWMRELFGSMASTGKFKTDTLLLISQGPYGILNTEGNAWDEQRHFCFRGLKEVGYGKSSSMEPVILEAVQELCESITKEINSDPGGIVDLSRGLYQSTTNTFWALVAGEKLSLGDRTSADLWSYWMKSLQKSSKTGLAFFPRLKYVSQKYSGYEDLVKSNNSVHAFLKGKVDEHSKTYVEGQKRDLVDIYIEQMNKTNLSGNSESAFFGKTGYKNTVAALAEMFLGGGEAMSVSIKWVAVYLSQHTEAQDKLQNEIDDVIGRNGNPSLADKSRMPYAEAVMLETFRLSSITPLGTPHELLEDVSFHGFTLPKGLILIANIYHAHHDPHVWGDPEEFRPERFLTDAGKQLKDYLVPFQAGKRQCIGERFARDGIFLSFVKMFQQFRFSPVSHVSKEDYFKPDVGLALLPKCSKFHIVVR